MGAKGLDAIAVRDRDAPARAIAALVSPGTQRLVVSGTYASPDTLDATLAGRRYRDVYAAL
jgi:hypothetical protein